MDSKSDFRFLDSINLSIGGSDGVHTLEATDATGDGQHLSTDDIMDIKPVWGWDWGHKLEEYMHRKEVRESVFRSGDGLNSGFQQGMGSVGSAQPMDNPRGDDYYSHRITIISEYISIGKYEFWYDRGFLNNVKLLTHELKIFSTHESRNKSRLLGSNANKTPEDTENDKNILIHKIKDNIIKVNNFLINNKHAANDPNNPFHGMFPNTTRVLSQTQTSVPVFSQTQTMDETLRESLFAEEMSQLLDNIWFESNGEEWMKSQTQEAVASSQQKRSVPISLSKTSVPNSSQSKISFPTSSQRKTPMSVTGQPKTSVSTTGGQKTCDLGIREKSYKYSNDEEFNEEVFEKLDIWLKDYKPFSAFDKFDKTPEECPEVPQNPTNDSTNETEDTVGTQAPDVPDIQIVNRHKWSNTGYSMGTGVTLIDDPQNKVRTQYKRHKQLKFVLQRILGFIEENIFSTKRDLYYQNVNLFQSQRVVDEIVDDLACSLRVSRPQLHITSSTRGLVFGHLSFVNTNGVLTNCLSSPHGIQIPNETERLTAMSSKALFVLIVEKDATFQQLIQLKIEEKYPLIMITGHGYPDLNTRAFVQILWNTFEIPIFGLVDGDAHGLEILCTFRHGSLALSYESPNLVVPAIKWLGILPVDIHNYQLKACVQIKLKDTDRKKIEDLKARPYMKANEVWTQQLDLLLAINRKVEIQSLAEHSPTFLLDVYLQSKLRYGTWI